MAEQQYENTRTFFIVVGCLAVGFSIGTIFSEKGVTMSNFNQWTGMGNFTRNPQLSFTPNQTPVVEFGLAVNRKWKGEDGAEREEVLFIECQCFGKRAEVISKHFQKGSPIFVQGRLKLERWESDGTTHSRIRVIVQNFEFIGRKSVSNGKHESNG